MATSESSNLVRVSSIAFSTLQPEPLDPALLSRMPIPSLLHLIQPVLFQLASYKSEAVVRNYNCLIRAMLKQALQASDADFKAFKIFVNTIHNQCLKDEIEAISAMREAEVSSQSHLRYLRQYAVTLREAHIRSVSFQGLPWEPYALGTSPAHQISEKRSLLQLLSTAVKLIQNCLKVSISPLIAVIEMSIQEERQLMAHFETYTAAMIQAEQCIVKGWPWKSPLNQKIYQLITTYSREIFDLQTLSLEQAYPKINRRLIQLYNYPETLTVKNQKLLLDMFKAAEREYFITEIIKQRSQIIRASILCDKIHQLINRAKASLRTGSRFFHPPPP